MKIRIKELQIANAAGECKLTPHVEELAKTNISAITVGAITLKARDGNPGHPAWYSESGDEASINSLGLPSPGLEYYHMYLPIMVKIAHDSGKLLRANIAGTPEEFVPLAEAIAKLGVDQIEFNPSCPNVWDGLSQKPIAAYNLELLGQLIEGIGKAVAPILLDVKLSAYEPFFLAKVAALVSSLKQYIRAVVNGNTFPNALEFHEDGTKVIKFGKGFGGLGGGPMRYINQGQVAQFRELLPGMILVIGAGGISKGVHIRNYLLAGADGGVQIGTDFFRKGPRTFDGLMDEFGRYVEEQE